METEYAGIAHGLHSYLSGVALAAEHGYALLYEPLRFSHHVDTLLDDLLFPQGGGAPAGSACLARPYATPSLRIEWAGGLRIFIANASVQLSRIAKNESARRISQLLHAAPPHSLVWVQKGRKTVAEPRPALSAVLGAPAPAVRATALWFRELFWRGVARASAAAASNAASVSPPPSAPDAPALFSSSDLSDRPPAAISIVLHVRRGDYRQYITKVSQTRALCAPARALRT